MKVYKPYAMVTVPQRVLTLTATPSVASSSRGADVDKDNTPFYESLKGCSSIAEIFELVKTRVSLHIGRERTNLMVGLSDLGTAPGGFIGAYCAIGGNIIVINKRILVKVKAERPELYNEYLFFILLHEYIHGLGFSNERETEELTLSIAKTLGNETIIELATDMSRFFPDIVFSPVGMRPEQRYIEFEHGIDQKDTTYIR
ncbi:MAG: hypothetical protein QF415_07430 [Candidatus Undinarchaeales archaeon]|jgi:hypothetical protein|nr:hypothetical protein [Candidatus Undinarchaeales archaeon]MDP7493706.1 hypothetical protein [Candidatus Undinarchaeales archaeon]